MGEGVSGEDVGFYFDGVGRGLAEGEEEKHLVVRFVVSVRFLVVLVLLFVPS